MSQEQRPIRIIWRHCFNFFAIFFHLFHTYTIRIRYEETMKKD
jgi:hypothetical protein